MRYRLSFHDSLTCSACNVTTANSTRTSTKPTVSYSFHWQLGLAVYTAVCCCCCWVCLLSALFVCVCFVSSAIDNRLCFACFEHSHRLLPALQAGPFKNLTKRALYPPPANFAKLTLKNENFKFDTAETTHFFVLVVSYTYGRVINNNGQLSPLGLGLCFHDDTKRSCELRRHLLL